LPKFSKKVIEEKMQKKRKNGESHVYALKDEVIEE